MSGIKTDASIFAVSSAGVEYAIAVETIGEVVAVKVESDGVALVEAVTETDASIFAGSSVGVEYAIVVEIIGEVVAVGVESDGVALVKVVEDAVE